MNRTISVKHTKDRNGRPLVVMYGLPGEGAEFSAKKLRALINTLSAIADECDNGAGTAYTKTVTYDYSSVDAETQRKKPSNQNESARTTGLTCEQFADLNKVKPQTVRARLCRFGSYYGVKPKKLANGFLVFPDIQVSANR